MALSFDNVNAAENLPLEEGNILAALITELNRHAATNKRHRDWYEGNYHVQPIGIAIPKGNSLYGVLDMTCGLPAKAVEAIQSRSVFEGFVFEGEQKEIQALGMDDIVRDNHFLSEYPKAVTDQLVHGCVFATVGATYDKKPRVRFHSAETASAFYDGAEQRISAGMAIIDSERVNEDLTWRPTIINLYLPYVTWVIKRANASAPWIANACKHSMARPMMEALVYDPDNHHPFGKSRITPQIETAATEYVRCMQRLSIGAEMFTSPQKIMANCPDEAFDMDKYAAYMTNFLLLGRDEEGETPTVSQLPAASMEPHISVKESILRDFARDANIPLSELGLVQENKYYESREQLIVDVENKLNAPNRDSLREIALMLLSIKFNKDPAALPKAAYSVMPLFGDPAMPSMATQADANVKVASARPSYAMTREFLYSMGMDKAKVLRIESEEQALKKSAETVTEKEKSN